MKRRLTRWSASVVLLWAGATQPALAEDQVSLRFAWPDGIVLHVERSFERQELRAPAEPPAAVRSSSRFTWTGTRSGERYRLAFSDFAVVRAEPEPGSSDALVQLEYVSRAVEPLLPTLVVDRAGQPVDLEGVPQLQKQLAASYGAIPGIDSDASARKMVEVLTSDQLVTQRALEDWNGMVQVWHGVDANVGDVQEISGASGAATGSPIDNVFSYSAESRVPCDATDEKQSCVRLVVAQLPRFEDARLAAQALLGFDFVTALGAPLDTSLELRNTFTTVTAPDSLVPLSYVKEKRWSASWVGSAGESHTVGRIDRWTYVFSRAR